MGRRAADKPVDHIPAIAMSRAIGDAEESHYRQGMLMAITVCATASTFPNAEMRDDYIRDMFSSLPEAVEGDHRDDYTWGFYQMVEILFGALTNLSGPELLKMPPSPAQ